jgi:methanogenic corrinoid protein MtbC1
MDHRSVIAYMNSTEHGIEKKVLVFAVAEGETNNVGRHIIERALGLNLETFVDGGTRICSSLGSPKSTLGQRLPVCPVAVGATVGRMPLTTWRISRM